MDEDDAIPQEASGAQSDGSITLFLGLYLLVLTFFILLVTISSLEKVKSQAVMNSLTSAFSAIEPPTLDPTQFVTKEGAIVAGKVFQSKMAELFSTAVQVIKIEIVQPGRLMRVVLPSDFLFFAGTTKIREAQFPLLDRLVASLSGRPPGLRYEMQFIIGSPYAEGTSLPIGGTLETSRASVFVRDMLSRGAPPDSLAVGLKPGNPDEITLWFHARLRDEERKRWMAGGGA
jgi:hypothetical protein